MSKPSSVYFFATCVVDLMAPQAGMDAIALLRDAGLRVEFPQAQSCCGQPAYTSGYTDEARTVAAAQLDLFPEAWPIVVPSGSCAGMMVHHWPRLFAEDPARLAKARDIGARVVEFSTFACDVLGLGARLVWETVDAIWDGLGDRSQDVNWYSKRTTLSAVYGATVLYWLGDDSPDAGDTRAFLDRRIEGVMRFETAKARISKVPGVSVLTQAATGWIRRPGARDPGSRRAPGPAATEGGDG